MHKKPAKIQSRPNGSTTVTNSTLFPVYGLKNTDSTIVSQDIAVANSEFFPLLGNMSKNFDKVKFKRISIRWVPVLSTLVSGDVAIYFDSDRRDPGPDSLTQAMTSKGCKTVPIWDRTTYRLTNDMIRPNELFATAVPAAGAVGVPTGENSFPSPGRIHIYVTPLTGVTFTTRSHIGNIVVDYQVEFHNPTHETAGNTLPTRFSTNLRRSTLSVTYSPQHIGAWRWFCGGCRNPPDFYSFLSLIDSNGRVDEQLAAVHDVVCSDAFDLRYEDESLGKGSSIIPLKAFKTVDFSEIRSVKEVEMNSGVTPVLKTDIDPPSDLRLLVEVYDPAKPPISDTDSELRALLFGSGTGSQNSLGWGSRDSKIFSQLSSDPAFRYLNIGFNKYTGTPLPGTPATGISLAASYLTSGVAERTLKGPMDTYVKGSNLDLESTALGALKPVYITPLSTGADPDCLWVHRWEGTFKVWNYGKIETRGIVIYYVAPHHDERIPVLDRFNFRPGRAATATTLSLMVKDSIVSEGLGLELPLGFLWTDVNGNIRITSNEAKTLNPTKYWYSTGEPSFLKTKFYTTAPASSWKRMSIYDFTLSLNRDASDNGLGIRTALAVHLINIFN